jgi:hypothetical protein
VTYAADISEIIADVTKSLGRKSVYHFTRAKNLPAMAHFDALWSGYRTTPLHAGSRRLSAMEVYRDGFAITVNAHLRIPDKIMEAGCTVERFRSFLDRHVFFWPTRRDCLSMLNMYVRREPSERFAVLELNASQLLGANAGAVRLSKYDSGSSPRYPNQCQYKKSTDMFVPLADFGSRPNDAVPVKPSEIKEILIEDRVRFVSQFLNAVYVQDTSDVPDNWAKLARPMQRFLEI